MATTELSVLDTTALVPTVVFAPGGVESIVAKIEAEVRSTKIDISTPAGRKACASLAYKVARSKTALDDMGKELVADIKAKVGLIDADRRIVRDRLDALKDEVRKPLDEFEAAEKRRVEGHEAAIRDIEALAVFNVPVPDSALVEARITALTAAAPRDWQEFAQRAAQTEERILGCLNDLLARSREAEAERAELERLRQEAEERRQQEEAARIEREAKEREERAAAAAREEAERRAAAEKEEIERQAREIVEAAERERLREEQEKAEAQRRAEQAERDRKAAEQRAAEQAEQAERDRIAAAEEAERQRVLAEERAAQRERDRIAEEKRAEEEAARKRAADRENQAKVNREAMAALVVAGLSEEASRTAVTAIAKREIPRVSIAY